MYKDNLIISFEEHFNKSNRKILNGDFLEQIKKVL